MIPGVDGALLLSQLVFQITQRGRIVQRMNLAGDDLCERAHLCTRNRILGQERWVRVRFVEILDDGERLNQRLTGICDESRHLHLRIDRAIFRPPVVAAVLDQMNGYGLVGETFEIERDAHAIRRRRSKIRIELDHASSSSSANPCSCTTSATSCAERSVSCFTARSNASRSAGVKISVRRCANSSACGASSSYMARPVAVSERKDSRMSARLLRRARSLRFSRSATARDTLVLCMWVWAPIALPVITPYWPSVTSTRHSGTPIR